MNPFGWMFDEVTASSLVKIDIEGNIVSPTPHHIHPAGFVIAPEARRLRPPLAITHHETPPVWARAHIPDGRRRSGPEPRHEPAARLGSRCHRKRVRCNRLSQDWRSRGHHRHGKLSLPIARIAIIDNGLIAAAPSGGATQFIAAVICGAASYMLMSFLMTAAPLALSMRRTAHEPADR